MGDLKGKNVEPIILTSASSDEIDAFKKSQQLAIPYFFVDATVLKTISRSNPGTWLLSNGVVKGKWHYNDTPTAEAVLQRLGQ